MGVERAVTRWYVQRQLLFAEIMRLEGALDPILQDAVPEQVEKGGAASEESAEAAQVQLVRKIYKITKGTIEKLRQEKSTSN